MTILATPCDGAATAAAKSRGRSDAASRNPVDCQSLSVMPSSLSMG